ncbi:MAG TPA: MaoC/PaaZ C-terminal domain-containing protein [Alphaproteobacteria bacterium]|jgi:acyl dehydratase|nr:MaoC/PaaZ C-terminal domain-containing protein [Alphaproteobacteria bacterium]
MKRYLEDYAVGEVFTTPARTVTEADIHTFAGLTGDWHPLHTDTEYAGKSVFGERIAHGFLVLSIGSALIFRLGQHVGLPESFIAFYGLDGLRFTAPVKIGDTIHLEWTIARLEPRDETTGLVTAGSRIINQRGETCCVYEVTIACGRRPGGAAP